MPSLPEWQPEPRSDNMGAALEAALAGGDVRASLLLLLPDAGGYRAMKTAYHHYQQINNQGGWPAIPAGMRITQEDQGGQVALLRQRLAISGDLASEHAAGN